MAFSTMNKVALGLYVEAKAFCSMHHRVKHRSKTAKGMTTTWPKTPEGFLSFLEYVGKVPEEMKRPTIGRKDHSKGYQPGNCGWQEYIDNCSESAKRTSVGRKHKKETKVKMKNSQVARRKLELKLNDGKYCFRHKKKSRLKMSRSHIGLKTSKLTRLKMIKSQRARRMKEASNV